VRRAGLLLAALSACHGAVQTPPRTVELTAKSAPPAPPAPDRTVIRLSSDADVDGKIAGELALSAVTELHFRPSHDVRVETLTAADGDGPVEVVRIDDGKASRFLLKRPAKNVRYTLMIGASKDDGFGPLAEPTELRGSGDDLLVLPERDGRFPIELRLGVGGAEGASASSFGLGSVERFEAGTRELRGAYFMAGDVGNATFHASDGNDFAGFIGHTAFDPRWVSAEAVGIRSAVDAYMGRTAGPNAPPVAILFAAVRRDDPPIAVATRTHGLLISADRRAPWSPGGRILVAQALTKRYVGGFLWIGDRHEEREGRFFSEGFSRSIARDILFDASILDAKERAAEVNALLATVTFSHDEQSLVMARGALMATALDAALHRASSGRKTLQHFLRARLIEAADARKDSLPLGDFMAKIRESAGEETERELSRALEGGAEIALPANLLGRCFRMVRKTLVPFELGFVTTADNEMKVEKVLSGSRAEAAGLRAGDVVGDLAYKSGRADIQVKLTITRQGKTIPITFLPAGAGKPGRLFERVRGIPDDQC
jgi:hypothetical protein